MKAKIKRQPNGRYQLSFVHALTCKRVRKLFDYRKDAELYQARIGEHLIHSDHLNGKRFIGNLIKDHLRLIPDSLVLSRKNSFESFCKTFNHLDVEQLTTQALREWFQRLRADNDYSNQTLACIRINLNAFCKWLVQEKYLTSNPILPIKFRVSKSMIKPRIIMTEAELKDALTKLKVIDLPAYNLIYALCHTGARKNELRVLTWEQVDFATGFITLMKTKNGEDRSVAMNDALRFLLEGLGAVRLQPSNPKEYVFLNAKGLLISPFQVDNGLQKLNKQHPNIKPFRCHDLRHSFAFNYLKNGGSMYSLQAVLGHKQISMTVDLYGGLKAQDVERVSPYGF